MGITSIADNIYLVGGYGVNFYSSALTFIPQSQSWQALVIDQDPGTNLGLTATGSYLNLLGGLKDGRPSSQNLAYQVIYTIYSPVIIK
jgi:hypothetical protein